MSRWLFRPGIPAEYTAEEEKEFLRDYLYPTLKKSLDHVKL